MEADRKPAPGSATAREMGCTCPIEQNRDGQGMADLIEHFAVDKTCPIHGFRTD